MSPMSEIKFPYAVSVDHNRRAIVLKGIGPATTDDTLRLISENKPLFMQYVDYNVLYDAVDLQIQSSAADMVRVADALFTDMPPYGRFAVLVPEDRAQLGRMFTALAETRGTVACVFTDPADAWNWLENKGA